MPNDKLISHASDATFEKTGPVSLLDTPLRRGGILLGPAKHGLDIQFRPSQDTLSPPLIVNQYPVFLTGPEKTVLCSELPVLVDFWAPWCGPCQMVAPIFKELASEYEGRVRLVKVNVDEAQQIASSLDIMGIPTIILFYRGKAIDRQVGVQPKAMLSEMLETTLLGTSRPSHTEEQPR